MSQSAKLPTFFLTHPVVPGFLKILAILVLVCYGINQFLIKKTCIVVEFLDILTILGLVSYKPVSCKEGRAQQLIISISVPHY